MEEAKREKNLIRRRRPRSEQEIYRNLSLLSYHFCRAPVYSAAGEFVLVQMKQRERRASCTSNRMRKGVRRGERKSLSLPTYIKQPHSGCQSAADILHKFQSFSVEERAKSRIKEPQQSTWPPLRSFIWGGFKKNNKSQSSLHTGIQKSLCSRESLISKILFYRTSRWKESNRVVNSVPHRQVKKMILMNESASFNHSAAQGFITLVWLQIRTSSIMVRLICAVPVYSLTKTPPKKKFPG